VERDAEEEGDERSQRGDLRQRQVHEDDLALYDVNPQIGQHAHHQHA
jgi:hypothetical protein